MPASTIDVHVYVPAGGQHARLRYVLRNFFVDLGTIGLATYAGPAAEVRRRRPCIVVHEPDDPVAGDLADGELWISRTPGGEGRWGHGGRGVPPMDPSKIDPVLPWDLLGFLFEAYAVDDVLRTRVSFAEHRPALLAGEDWLLAPWIDRARRAVLERLGIARRDPGVVVAVTHDVDAIHPYSPASMVYHLRNAPWALHTAFHSYRSYVTGCAKHLARVLWTRNSPRTELTSWFEAERRLGIRSTYYFLEDRASRHDLRNGWYSYADRVVVDGRPTTIAGFMQQLGEAGFEVGPHVGVHAHRDGEYARSVAGVARIAGPPISTRHHWCMRAPGVTLSLMEAAGLRYDLNFGDVGFPLGTCRPFHLYDVGGERASEVIALPTVLMDDVLFKAHRYGFSRAEARQVSTRILEAARDESGIVAISFHPGGDLTFFTDLVRALQERGIAMTTAAQAGALAASRFPRIVEVA